MKALVYTGPETLSFQDAVTPDPSGSDVLVQIDRVGICGSDMHAYLGHDNRRPAPLILGHEAAGVIQSGSRKGERVTINPLVSCGTCRACLAHKENLCPNRQIISMPPREGAFAQFVTMPEANLIPINDALTFQQAALAEPLAVCWHAVRLAYEALPSAENALVIGGGAIGLGSSLSLKAMGLTDVTIAEPNEVRRRYLANTCDENTVAQASGGFDIVVDAVGIATTRAVASELTHPGGVVAHIGLGDAEGGLDIRRMTLQEITFIGTYTYTAQDFRDTVAAMEAGRLGALDWIEERALSDGAAAFADIRAGRVAAPKIVLVP